ncbi:MAG TPA: tetratricopeptide repeat protein [Vicinamibacterales bacterium]|nr:tetratricopeptide repeat protein [Vicinamibacterales bacterium]
MLRRWIAGLVVLTAASAAPLAQKKPEPPKPPPSIAPLDLARLLDTYASGRFDEAVQAVARAGDTLGKNLRAHWTLDAPSWIEADPAARAQRLLVAAAFALETENVRVERGEWGTNTSDVHCPGTCVLDWAQEHLVLRGPADAAERTWYLAAAALAGGVRDWRYLERPANPRAEPPIPAGLMGRALERFPDDPRLRLEQALAVASRYAVTIEGERYATSLPPGVVVNVNGMRGGALVAPRPTARDQAITMLAALVEDPVVGPEAGIRLGYLHWAIRDDVSARAELTRAAADAKEIDDRYLAEFLLGWVAMQAGDAAAAGPHFEAALAARPESQSAAVALAALTLQQGDATRAHDIAQSSLDKRPTDVDPWRLILYGHHSRLAGLITQLRSQVHP